MSENIKNNDVLFEMHGISIRKDRRYIIIDKPDNQAPSGFVKAGATKLPSAGVNDVFPFGYNTESETWDTGFYAQSACYRNLPQDQRELLAKTRTENILKPFVESKGYSDMTMFSQNNNTFWDNYMIRVGRKDVFDTTIPQHVMDLYGALLTRHICPEDKKNHPDFKQAAYIVVDVEKNVQLEHQIVNKTYEAREFLSELQNQNPKAAVAVLTYVGTKLGDNADATTIRMTFENKIAGDLNKVESFLEVAKKYNSEPGFEDIVHIYHALSDRTKAAKNVARQKTGMLTFQGIEIGPDLKTAARNIAIQHDLEEIKDKILMPDAD